MQSGCGESDNNNSNNPPDLQPYTLVGVNFSPYMDGQDPNIGSLVDGAQITERLDILVGKATWVRSFGSTHGLEYVGNIARGFGFNTALQAWISDDLSANETELTNLISAGQQGDANILIVGSEVLLRGDLSGAKLIEYMDRVRQAVPGVPVATADTYTQLLAHSEVVDASDVILVNYYPYWEGVALENAVSAINDWHQLIVQAAHDKQVIVAETGWPSEGDTQGLAVPSPENAAYFFKNFISWARANNTDYFYFEAFDEPWKSQYEGPQGAHWGIWDRYGNLKAGMNAVFLGETIEDNWSQNTVIGGPGEPALEFTYVPHYGSFENLEGRVLHVAPRSYKVAVYIYVSGWWTKPYFSQPLTTIQADGRWVCDITTGGVDERATRIAAYLVPLGYQPPSMSGGGSLPGELNVVAASKVMSNR
jgi:exo-beta-1,3-glucanase (GH17 family)